MQLADIVISATKQRQNIHPATRVFQALRIVVNKELENIKSFLSQAVPALQPKGRLVCISFHSLEDRLVKHFFQDHTQEISIVTPKVIVAQESELAINPSARSARLRAAEKI
jgi:16S rRNA (cytosine1402-N4)-methyltransferase